MLMIDNYNLSFDGAVFISLTKLFYVIIKSAARQPGRFQEMLLRV